MISESQKTAEKIAQEHRISEKTVKRSAGLFRSHQAVKEAAPDVAKKIESGEIKAPKKDVMILKFF